MIVHGSFAGHTAMQHFEAIRSHVGSLYALNHNAPYQIGLELPLEHGRRQGIYLAEIEGEHGRRYLRISTPIGPLEHADPARCLRFNWEQRTGFFAVSDLDGRPWLHLCDNCPYAILDGDELMRLIRELGTLGDRLERMLLRGADAS